MFRTSISTHATTRQKVRWRREGDTVRSHEYHDSDVDNHDDDDNSGGDDDDYTHNDIGTTRPSNFF